MTTTPRTITVAILAAAVLVALVATVYSFRSFLVDTPMVAAALERVGWRTGAEDGMASSMSDPMPAMSEPAAVGSPRAEVNIDPRRQQLIGVRTAPVERRVLTKSIRAVGTVRYDETRLADVNVKVAGWIEELYVDYTGQFIEAGQPLFTLYSPELLTTQQEYLLALESRAQLRDSQIADARVYADRLVDAARQRLTLWDLPLDEIEALEERREPRRAMPFRAPVGGFVIEKRVVEGQHVSAGMSLYTIADLSAVWVEADLYEQELPLVSEGALATITVDAYPEERFQGRVLYIYPYVEEQTRTVRVRFGLPNPRGRLKPGMYANVALDTVLGDGVAVPVNALLDSGADQYVFVSQGDGYFEPRSVVVGRRLGETIQILDGLDGGEIVATSATFFIDSESQLRAALQGFEPVPRAGEGDAAPRAPGHYVSQRPRPAAQRRQHARGGRRRPGGSALDRRRGLGGFLHGADADDEHARDADRRDPDSSRRRCLPGRRRGHHGGTLGRDRAGEPRGPAARQPNTDHRGALDGGRLMIERIITWCASNRFLVFTGTAVLTLWGFWAMTATPLDAVPDISDVQVIVSTEWTGRSPDLIEDQITYPLVSALISTPRVRTVRGFTDFGISYVYVIFEDGTDMYWARSRVVEYLQGIRGQLPDGVNPGDRAGRDRRGMGLRICAGG